MHEEWVVSRGSRRGDSGQTIPSMSAGLAVVPAM